MLVELRGRSARPLFILWQSRLNVFNQLNILCIGGAISIDRERRMKQQVKYALSQTGYYWPDETPISSKEPLKSSNI